MLMALRKRQTEEDAIERAVNVVRQLESYGENIFNQNSLVN